MSEPREVVIVGSGLAGSTLADSLHKKRPSDRITVVTSVREGVYSRPLLSHAFAKPENRTRMLQKSFATWAETGIQVLMGTQAIAIDRARQILRIRTSAGAALTSKVNAQVTSEMVPTETELRYDILVLATGSAAAYPPAWEAQRPWFHTLNGLEDLHSLLGLREAARSAAGPTGRLPIAVIGGGLIGCEVASDLALAGDAVTLYHGASRLLERVISEEASTRLQIHLSGMGIEVRLNERVMGFGTGPCVMTEANPLGLPYAGILVATGFRPRTDLAAAAGLSIARGVVVNSFFQTADTHIYAVGDGAEVSGSLYPFVSPVRSQALHLAELLAEEKAVGWSPPAFTPTAKIHGFKA